MIPKGISALYLYRYIIGAANQSQGVTESVMIFHRLFFVRTGHSKPVAKQSVVLTADRHAKRLLSLWLARLNKQVGGILLWGMVIN